MCSIESATKSRTPSLSLSFLSDTPQLFSIIFFYIFTFHFTSSSTPLPKIVLSKCILLLGEPGIYIYNIRIV
uniref:Uncharacterized protein n=1 Tax=Daphnia magna TaxID=35525 RepID=A0A0P5A1S4_9CRUS